MAKSTHFPGLSGAGRYLCKPEPVTEGGSTIPVMVCAPCRALRRPCTWTPSAELRANEILTRRLCYQTITEGRQSFPENEANTIYKYIFDGAVEKDEGYEEDS